MLSKWALKTAQTATHIVGVPEKAWANEKNLISLTNTCMYVLKGVILGRTPSNNGVPVEVSFLWKECLNEQSKEIQSLNEQPEVVWQNTIMKKYHHRLTLHLQKEKLGVNAASSKWICIYIYSLDSSTPLTKISVICEKTLSRQWRDFPAFHVLFWMSTEFLDKNTCELRRWCRNERYHV